MTLPYRFYKKFLFPIAARWQLGSSREKYQQKRMSVASNSSKVATTHPLLSLNDPGTDSLKIVNNFFGIEEARPMGPLIEMIGPIYNAHYDPLPAFIQQFLDLHQRVVFVAFGQHAAAKPIDTTKILTQLLDLLETKVIDGFIWGLVKSSSGLPDTVTTQSGRIYDVSKEFLFDNNNKDAEELKRKNKQQQQHPDVILLPWAPQFSILKHPSVITYLSHGGGMSIFEALYAGKRTVIKPFFGDQPGHALFFEREQLGGYLNMQDQNKGTGQVFDDPFKTLQRVIQDKDGVIQKNVNRYQALVQIRAKNAVVRGADLVEEVLFTNKDGYLPHRHDVRKKLSYLKANDYDLYLCLVGIATTTLGLLRFVYLKMIQSFFIIDKQPKNKIKDL
ncbi:hypothetical protein INT45_007137 [Circinella minor]|uniref:Uncharacterized protein n=1 Tax=Circinella minor TaxID=1195481 RepID=A0A8H7S557_9FUNG|nr:hypothetical protein INT45_007137 [Circinella minor]